MTKHTFRYFGGGGGSVNLSEKVTDNIQPAVASKEERNH